MAPAPDVAADGAAAAPSTQPEHEEQIDPGKLAHLDVDPLSLRPYSLQRHALRTSAI